MNKLLNSTIEEAINDQIAREGGPKHKPVPPLESPVLARQHTPVYQMHRYFARRPWNVFEHIIRHYTDAGDLILDPFCGGGVTVYEGLKSRRRVIGVDLNPLATWITKMQVMPVDLDAVEEAFRIVVEKFKPVAEEMYGTTCDICGKPAVAEWFEWSNVFRCPRCDTKVILAHAKKRRNACYECTNEDCPQLIIPNDSIREPDLLINKKVKCVECGEKVLPVNQYDIKKARTFIREKNKIITQEGLYVPEIEFPDGDRARDDAIFNKGVKTFGDLFTPRNLIQAARLKKIISEVHANKEVRESLWYIFSASLRYINKMVFRNEAWRSLGAVEWAGHAYWLPNAYIERDILWAFENRKNAFIKGKKQSAEELEDFPKSFAKSKGWTYQVLTQSSEKLPLAYKSVDCIITDPPFGGNVQYAELSDFWVVWLPEIHKTEGVIDNSREAIQTRHTGFASEKGIDHYEDLLYHIFRECHRVLKDDGYMVMTFHNRDVRVWMALHRSARRAGFELPSREEVSNHGMVYQDFIENLKQTFHSRASGSLLGDFILTFKKVEARDIIEHPFSDLSTEQEKEIVQRIRENIEYHGGIDTTAIGNIVVEILADMNLLHRFAGSDLSTIYRSEFVYSKKDKKWYTKEMLGPENRPLKTTDVWPVEEVIEGTLYDYFKEHKFASEDELLFFLFQKLVNSQRPGMEAVKKVLSRCTRKAKKKGYQREVYYWKTARIPPTFKPKGEQQNMFEGVAINHNDVIRKLALRFIDEGFGVHIGATETRKDEKLRELSTELSHLDLGVQSRAFEILREIDLLILKGNSIVKAIEVVTTFGTFGKAVNERFRNLLKVVPNLNYDLEIYLPKDDLSKGRKELDTPANIDEGLSRKISLLEIQ